MGAFLHACLYVSNNMYPCPWVLFALDIRVIWMTGPSASLESVDEFQTSSEGVFVFSVQRA
jgi:hypothetical protein